MGRWSTMKPSMQNEQLAISNAKWGKWWLGRSLALPVPYFALLIANFPFYISLPAARADGGKPLVIKAGRLLTVTKGTIDNGVIVVRDGKIAAVGKQGEIALPPDAEVMDVADRWVMPGQVDLHTHIGNNSGLHDYVHSLN